MNDERGKQCGWWHGHNWGMWNIAKEGNLLKDGKMSGIMIIQMRTCKDCGFSQLDSQTRTMYD